MDSTVQNYVDRIPPAHRALFDRLHGLIMSTYPDATVELSYSIPAYEVHGRRLYVGAWKHGVSLYGWRRERIIDIESRHPALVTSKGTIRLRPSDSSALTDDDLVDLIHAALAP